MNALSQHGGKPVSSDYYYPQSPKQTRVELVTRTFEYQAPFKYDNIEVRRHFLRNREAHGVEMNAVNYHVDEQRDCHDFPADAIRLSDDSPIVRLVVVGSSCTPPGWIQIECEPTEDFFKPEEFEGVVAPRFRVDGLWGMHMRIDALVTRQPGVTPVFNRVDDQPQPYAGQPASHATMYPSTAKQPLYAKTHFRENPLAGMSCAVFEIPASKAVTIYAGSQIPAWQTDNYPGDHHYSVRMIRTDVLTNAKPDVK